jgi:hypothetical protein
MDSLPMRSPSDIHSGKLEDIGDGILYRWLLFSLLRHIFKNLVSVATESGLNLYILQLFHFSLNHIYLNEGVLYRKIINNSFIFRLFCIQCTEIFSLLQTEGIYIDNRFLIHRS